MSEIPRIHATENDLHLAMSEMHNMGEFELVGRNGERVILVAVEVETCDECGNDIPDNEESMVNPRHAKSCSLYGPNASKDVAR